MDIVKELLESAGRPMDINELIAAAYRSETSVRKAVQELMYLNEIHWCGSCIDQAGVTGRRRMLYLHGPAPIDALEPEKSRRRGRYSRINAIPLPIPRPALHPIISWGVAA